MMIRSGLCFDCGDVFITSAVWTVLCTDCETEVVRKIERDQRKEAELILPSAIIVRRLGESSETYKGALGISYDNSFKQLRAGDNTVRKLWTWLKSLF